MRKITQLNDKAIAVEVPEGAKGFFVHDGKIWTDETYRGIFSKKLPPGSYSILGRPEELTIKQIVEIKGTLRNGSFNDWLRSKDVDPKSVIILIKQ